MKEIRLVGRAKNNIFLSICEKKGLFTNRVIADYFGIPEGKIGKIINLAKGSVLNSKGDYLESSKIIAKKLNLLEEDLFPFSLYSIEETKFNLEMNIEDRVKILDDSYIFDRIESNQLKKSLNDILDTIPPREKLAIEHKYGLNGEEPKTLEAVGMILNVSKERCRQIICKGERRLRHPKRVSKLIQFMDFEPTDGDGIGSSVIKIKRLKEEIKDLYRKVSSGEISRKEYRDFNSRLNCLQIMLNREILELKTKKGEL